MTYRLQSKISVPIFIITTVFFLAAAGLATLLVLFWNDPDQQDQGSKVMLVIMAAVFGLVSVGFWLSYFKIRIEGGRVTLRGIIKQEDFFLHQITGYALTYQRIKGRGEMEILHIGLPGGRYFSVNPQNYRNYGDLYAALTEGKMPDPKVLAKAKKHQAWQVFLGYSILYGAGIAVMAVYVDSPQFMYAQEFEKWLVIFSFTGAFLYLLWKYREYTKLPKV